MGWRHRIRWQERDLLHMEAEQLRFNLQTSQEEMIEIQWEVGSVMTMGCFVCLFSLGGVEVQGVYILSVEPEIT